MSLAQRASEVLKALEYKRATNQYKRYSPYPKQVDFHNARERERLLMAANQVGKTYSAGMEACFHATGLYPDWWEGQRFTKPTIGWVCGVSLEGLRDGAQRIVLGTIGQEGTGTIPKDRIIKIGWKQNQAVDYVRVRWGPLDSGQETFISFKSYDQGRAKFQAASVDWVWFDEEPPYDIYSEGITRTNATRGIIFMTFTPLMGATEVVRRFMNEESENRKVINMTIEDAEHINEEDRKRIISSYKPHEIEARTKGIPVLGSGLIYPIEESLIKVEPFPIPKHWLQIGGMDFGWDHPFAAVQLAIDPDKDIIYLHREYRISHRTPLDHCNTLRLWGTNLPWAWPHDGLNHDKQSGEQLKSQYKKHGLAMLPNRATHDDGTNGVEAGLFEILQRMQTGRFKVFNTCHMWFEEARMYYREDGKIVKLNDDILDASRYAVMMRRHARITDEALRAKRREKMVETAVGYNEVRID